jgi:hypoxanthine phosphoribosyltransferase
MKTEILLTKEQVGFIISELRCSLIDYYRGYEELVVITILDGAVFFASELFSEGYDFDVHQHFVKIKSYCGTQSTEPKIEMCGFNQNHITSKDVLIIDDILDTGRTLEFVTELIQGMSPRSVDSCVLLQKIGTRKRPVDAKFVGAKFYSTKFVFGCGMDHNEKDRDLEDIWITEEET